MEPRPSEVRRWILDDHVVLRELLTSLQDLVTRAASGDPRLVPRVRDRGADLRKRFLAHLDLEDRYLVPALRTIDAWGEERAARVSKEHGEQRERMDHLLEQLGGAVADWELVSELAILTEDLLVDMAHEEETVLQEDLLRDDPVAIQVETG